MASNSVVGFLIYSVPKFMSLFINLLLISYQKSIWWPYNTISKSIKAYRRTINEYYTLIRKISLNNGFPLSFIKFNYFNSPLLMHQQSFEVDKGLANYRKEDPFKNLHFLLNWISFFRHRIFLFLTLWWDNTNDKSEK